MIQSESIRPTLLIVEDDDSNRKTLERIFAKEPYVVCMASDGQEGLDIVREQVVNVVISDLMMPRMDGLELLKTVKTLQPDIDFILVTAYGTVERAVEAMKEGAYDFITKPFKRADVLARVRRAMEKQLLLIENRRLREQLAGVDRETTIIGRSSAIRGVLELVEQVAPSTATVLLLGESGTGKELFARQLHARSDRKQRPFIAVNCAAIPETILESELFGYESGAFTGATRRKQGRFELAHTGTLFFDEVGEIPPSMQVKLLRVLQEGTFERLGGTQPIHVDVRVIAATNRDLEQEVREGRFREDLFYRLNVIPVEIPPLRDRREDVALLAHHFLSKFADKNQKAAASFSKEATSSLMDYDWPGNVRELENAIERAVILAKDVEIGLSELPPNVARGPAERQTLSVPIGTPLEDVERLLIRETLRMTRGDKTTAARLLGIATRTIYRKLDREELRRLGQSP
ncbi:MAG: DNA-binding response regulator [Myxococcales bacterium]|nr:DNA-binding response regulator [Myxococcales bacterium]